ncbi:hypothetical protein FIU89_00235 [Roseovarius sp. THAF27]|nr:hypothetical protein [Roseovarius sp. THAF27]QFT79018.1 hypothetical protein FIU89_00235 [Roseovarius sp. THAF27]
MQTTGFILLLAAGVIVFFGGNTTSGTTLPSVVSPDLAGIRAQ